MALKSDLAGNQKIDEKGQDQGLSTMNGKDVKSFDLKVFQKKKLKK